MYLFLRRLNILTPIILTMLVISAHAGKEKGVAVDAALGFPIGEIINPDSSVARYNGLSLLGRMHIPIVEERYFSFDLMGSMRYMDLKNLSNKALIQEYGQHIGLGGGMEIRVTKFFLGGEYHLMKARHYTVGNVSNALEFEFPTNTVYGGFMLVTELISISLSYSVTTGTIPSSFTNLTADTPYSDKTYWLHIKYSTGFSLTDFGKSLMRMK